MIAQLYSKGSVHFQEQPRLLRFNAVIPKSINGQLRHFELLRKTRDKKAWGEERAGKNKKNREE